MCFLLLNESLNEVFLINLSAHPIIRSRGCNVFRAIKREVNKLKIIHAIFKNEIY
jgi:hypothetical protein